MAKTPSTMLDLGTIAPDFNLPCTISEKSISLSVAADDKPLVVMFICNHCPFVIHVIEEISSIAKKYKEKGISFVAISSNDIENYPDDSPDKMKTFAAKYNLNFPYLYDESQEVAKSYKAACTPDFYVFNKDKSLVYRGQLDDSRPGNGKPVDGKDLRAALDCIVENKAVSDNQLPSIGCNIKWKAN